MNLFRSVFSARLIFVPGIINMVSGALALPTCRCVPALHFTGKLMQNKLYSNTYKYNCTIWWVFWISAIVYAVFAIALYSVPF